jgi:hypothetical protein
VLRILLGHIVFRHFMSAHFSGIAVGVLSILHTGDGSSLPTLALFYEFLDTFGAGFGDLRETLQVAGLAG